MSLGISVRANDLLLQPDGKFLAVGALSPQAGGDLALTRYLSNGTLDPTFGIGEWLTADPETGGCASTHGVLLPDGKSLIVWKEGSTTLATALNPTVRLPLGIHHLSLTVTDPSGESASDSVDVAVRDTTPPTITTPADFTVPQTTLNGGTVTYVVTATDLVSAATLQCTPPSGSNFPIGVATVHWMATDAAGNSAERSFNVTVSDPARSATAKFTENGTLVRSATTRSGSSRSRTRHASVGRPS